MENSNPAKALALGSDDDVWNRVKALAPSKAPVKGRLFRETHKNKAAPDVLPKVKTPAGSVDSVEDKAEAASQALKSTPPLILPQYARQNAKPEVEVETISPEKALIVSDDVTKPSGSKISRISAQTLPQTTGHHDGLAWERLRIATKDLAERKAMAHPGLFLDRDAEGARPFDQLRTRLFQSLKSNGWSRVAVTSPAPGCGSTFTACNLALSLSRLMSTRTVLMDLNLRSPGIARALGLRPDLPLRRLLTGEVPLSEGLVRYSDNLAVGLTAQGETASAEVLHDPRTAATLDEMKATLTPDVMLYDLPPMLGYDDVDAFLPQVDGVLLVIDGTVTVARQVAECERMIAGKTRLLGVVLNKSRDKPSKRLRYAG